jgi:hypothetical protein
MSTAIDNSQLDKAEAEKIVASVSLIPEVERIDVNLYTDHTGDPAFQLVFRLRRDVQVDDSFMRRFIDFSSGIQRRILDSDLNRFPYTRLEQAA